MKRSFLITTLMILSLFAVAFYGCSDDDNGTNVVKEEGSLDDPMFMEIQEFVGEGLEETNYILFDMLFNDIDSVFNMMAAAKITSPAESLLVAWHSNTNYWYFYASDTNPSDPTEYYIMVDSFQFIHGTTPSQWPDSALLSRVNTGASFNYYMGDEGHYTMSQNISIVSDDMIGGDPVTINGTRGLSAYFPDWTIFGDTSYACIFQMNFTGTANNVVMDFDGNECPSGGVYTQAGTIGISCSGDSTFSHNDSWTITETFHDNYIGDVVFENSTTRWTFQDTCTSGPIYTTYPMDLVQDQLNHNK